MSNFQLMSGPRAENRDDDVYAGDSWSDPEDDSIECDELEGIEWPVLDDDFTSY